MSAAEPQETYLTVAEVAEMLKINQQTVRNWIDQGSLRALRVGRRVRIKRSDFDRLVEQNYGPEPARSEPLRGPSAEDFWGGTPVGLVDASAIDRAPTGSGAEHADGPSGPGITGGARQ